MQTLAHQVFIEEEYPGVTLGAIALPHGLIQIDAPPSPEDGRSWRGALLGLNSGVERLLVNLDAHPDRTLGARSMDCTIVAHENTARAFRNRPNTFKAQGDETGADWESVAGLGSIRWAPPEISFTERMSIEWSNFPVILESHPGPGIGASWSILPEAGIVFVGDLVLKNQPPFLAQARLPEWLESLKVLMAKYKNYTIVSGRGGVVPYATVQAQYEQLAQIHTELESLAKKQSGADAVESLVGPLVVGLKMPGQRQKQYAQRMAYGLRQYYTRFYLSSGNSDSFDE